MLLLCMFSRSHDGYVFVFVFVNYSGTYVVLSYLSYV